MRVANFIRWDDWSLGKTISVWPTVSSHLDSWFSVLPSSCTPHSIPYGTTIGATESWIGCTVSPTLSRTWLPVQGSLH